MATAYLSILSYFAAYITMLAKTAKCGFFSRNVGKIIYSVGIGLHGFLLYQWIDTPVGHDLNVLNLISMVTWLIALTLIIATVIYPVDNLILLITPMAVFSIVLNIAEPLPKVMLDSISPKATIHIFLALTSLSMLMIAGLQAGLIAIQNYLLKKYPFSKLVGFMPPLEKNEKIWINFLYISFALLSATLIESVLFLEQLDSFSNKLLFSVGAWLVLFVILWKHFNSGYKGMRSEMWSIIAFVLLIWSYFGSKIFLIG